MGTPRLLFVTSDRPGRWNVPGPALPDAPPPTVFEPAGWTAWRLLGGNNREIARSSHGFDNFVDCYQAARFVQENLGSATELVRYDDAQNLWAWRVEIDGVTRAASGRLYQRHRECLFNLSQFLDLMPDAVSAYDAILRGPIVPEQTTVDLTAIENDASRPLSA